MQANGCRCWLVGVLWLCQSVFVTAQTENDNTLYQLDIPAQTIEVALQRLARQTGKQLFFSHDQINTLTSNPVTGRYSLEQALQQLLQGTPLTGNLTKSGVIVITLSDEHRADSGRGDTMKGKQSKKQLLAAVIGMFAGSSGVLAQESAADDKGNVWALEEVVVTAQKREQNLQDVPISISVLGGHELDSSNFEGIKEALNQVAGLNMVSHSSSGVKLTVRGVGAASGHVDGSSAVGYYVDEVPFGFIRSAVLPDANPYDLERVEALRGPQGTLYGANALNGVVRVITKDADTENYELKLRGTLSTTEDGGDNYRGDLAVNVPLIQDKLGARAVFGYRDYSGWIDRPNIDQENANDAEVSSVRLKVKAKPTDELVVKLSAWQSRDDRGAYLGATSDNVKINDRFIEEPVSSDFDTYGIVVEYDFPAFSLLSATSYIDYKTISFFDIASGGDILGQFYDSEVFSQEVRATSLENDGVWEWSLGGSYREAEDDITNTLPIFWAGNTIELTDESKSFAVFGELTRSLLEGELDFTVGLRYFEDDVSFSQSNNTDGPRNPPATSNSTFDKVTPRAVLTWYPNDQMTVYGSYSEGFRSGYEQQVGIQEAIPDQPPVTEDSLTNYEIGTKGTLWEDRFSYDLALFYIKWSDVQQTLRVVVPGGPSLRGGVNGDSASGAGVDIALNANFTERLSLGLSLGWNDLTSDKDIISDGVVVFEKGDRMNESPEYTAGVTLDYRVPITDSGYTGRFSGSINYHSKLENHLESGGESVVTEGGKITNSRVSFELSAPENWQLTLFVDNVTNEDDIVRPTQIATWDYLNTTLRPRTAGVQFEYQY